MFQGSKSPCVQCTSRGMVGQIGMLATMNLATCSTQVNPPKDERLRVSGLLSRAPPLLDVAKAFSQLSCRRLYPVFKQISLWEFRQRYPGEFSKPNPTSCLVSSSYHADVEKYRLDCCSKRGQRRICWFSLARCQGRTQRNRSFIPGKVPARLRIHWRKKTESWQGRTIHRSPGSCSGIIHRIAEIAVLLENMVSAKLQKMTPFRVAQV